MKVRLRVRKKCPVGYTALRDREVLTLIAGLAIYDIHPGLGATWYEEYRDRERMPSHIVREGRVVSDPPPNRAELDPLITKINVDPICIPVTSTPRFKSFRLTQ